MKLLSRISEGTVEKNNKCTKMIVVGSMECVRNTKDSNKKCKITHFPCRHTKVIEK
jgi:hypothetical protein